MDERERRYQRYLIVEEVSGLFDEYKGAIQRSLVWSKSIVD